MAVADFRRHRLHGRVPTARISTRTATGLTEWRLSHAGTNYPPGPPDQVHAGHGPGRIGRKGAPRRDRSMGQVQREHVRQRVPRGQGDPGVPAERQVPLQHRHLGPDAALHGTVHGGLLRLHSGGVLRAVRDDDDDADADGRAIRRDTSGLSARLDRQEHVSSSRSRASRSTPGWRSSSRPTAGSRSTRPAVESASRPSSCPAAAVSPSPSPHHRRPRPATKRQPREPGARPRARPPAGRLMSAARLPCWCR